MTPRELGEFIGREIVRMTRERCGDDVRELREQLREQAGSNGIAASAHLLAGKMDEATQRAATAAMLVEAADEATTRWAEALR